MSSDYDILPVVNSRKHSVATTKRLQSLITPVLMEEPNDYNAEGVNYMIAQPR